MQGYTDEPIGKILSNIANSDTVLLDRWNLKIEPNPDASDSSDGKDSLPLSVVNNYFSLGVDAHIALEFHEARGKRLNCVIRIAENSIILVIFFTTIIIYFLSFASPSHTCHLNANRQRADIKKINLSFCTLTQRQRPIRKSLTRACETKCFMDRWAAKIY